MLLTRWFVCALMLAAAIGPDVGHAQEGSASTRRDTAKKAGGGQRPNSVQIYVDGHGWGRVSDMPAMIFKDADCRVVMMVAPGDTTAASDTAGGVEPAWIDKIDIVKPVAAIAALGQGFEKGILIITLTSAGSEVWRRRRTDRQAASIAH